MFPPVFLIEGSDILQMINAAAYHKTPLLRKSCGLNKTMKPFKRKRRVTGYCLFVQESLKGCGLRIGSAAYRDKLRNVSSSWNDLSQDRRGSYDARAIQQQTVRNSLSGETLSSGSTSSTLTLALFFSH